METFPKDGERWWKDICWMICWIIKTVFFADSKSVDSTVFVKYFQKVFGLYNNLCTLIETISLCLPFALQLVFIML